MSRKDCVEVQADEPRVQRDFQDVLERSRRLLAMQADPVRKAGSSYLEPSQDESKPWETYI